MNESHATIADSAWKPLYRVGGAAALTIVVLFVLQLIVFVASPPPSTVIGYFTLFHKNALLGLLLARRLFQLGQGVSKEEANRN